MADHPLQKWFGPVAVVVGIGVAFGGATVVQAELKADVSELRKVAETHAVQPSHHDAESRLTLNEERLKVLDEERRDMRQTDQDLKDGQARIIRRLDALCAATPRCRIGSKSWSK